MFTGIIEEVGIIENVIKKGNVLIFIINANTLINNINKGASVAVNGVCLTVTAIKNNSFTVEVTPQTVKTTNLGLLRINDKVNLETSLTLNKKLDGHIVLGHIDGVGKIKNIKKIKGQIIMNIKVSPNIIKYIVKRGSICVDGVSLTVTEVKNDTFEIALIPYTLSNTTLGLKKIGNLVNIEVDIISKYIEKLVGNKVTLMNLTVNKNYNLEQLT